MRKVSLRELIGLPGIVVYLDANVTPNFLGIEFPGIKMKWGNGGFTNDFVNIALAGNLEHPDPFKANDDLDDGLEVPLDLNGFGREGTYDKDLDTKFYYVLSDTEVKDIVGLLNQVINNR